MSKNKDFSPTTPFFRGNQLPEREARLVGYSALINAYNIQVPLPDNLSAISKKHSKYEQGFWKMYTPRHLPENSLYGHLTFALKYEGVDLGVLKSLFDTVSPNDIIYIIKQEPTGSYSRRIWFLYEWVKESKIDVPNAQQINFVNTQDHQEYPKGIGSEIIFLVFKASVH